jgi:general stress protein 26
MALIKTAATTGESTMSNPTTTIDLRFSDPGAQATSWDETRSRLETAELFWITTVRHDGRPHATPLVAVWLGEALHFCTGPEEQKAINLSHNPHVILSTGSGQWDTGLDIVVEGIASRVTERSELLRLAEAWTTKWDGRWRFSVTGDLFQHPGGGEALVFAVAPKKIFAFGKGTFSQTRHHF